MLLTDQICYLILHSANLWPSLVPRLYCVRPNTATKPGTEAALHVR